MRTPYRVHRLPLHGEGKSDRYRAVLRLDGHSVGLLSGSEWDTLHLVTLESPQQHPPLLRQLHDSAIALPIAAWQEIAKTCPEKGGGAGV